MLVARSADMQKSTVDIDGVLIGGARCVIIAGPCAVESAEQLLACAHAAKAAGAQILRGGAFKPRTSPYSFQGLKEEGLQLLAMAKAQTGLKIVTEVMSPDTVDLVASYADMLQVGARNMQNFALLEALGAQPKPVLLKRGISATYHEWLLAAEYIALRGNLNIVLCERGIRTFETMTRNTLDLAAIPVMQQLSHLPIIVDPSHAVGRVDCVAAMSCAALAAGADGIMLEIHPQPDKALSDGQQALTPLMLEQLMIHLRRLADAIGREIV